MKITMVMAQTADGRIAGRPGQSPLEWTSPQDREHFARVTRKAGVVIMGRNTFDAMKRPLAGRLNVVLTTRPVRDAEVPGLLEFMSAPPARVVQVLEERGFTQAVLGGGAKTNGSFLEAGLVDEILLTQEGILFGQGPAICEGLTKNIFLEISNLSRLSPSTILIKYKILNKDITKPLTLCSLS
jgi:dihydrofolate reductase